MAPLWCLCAAVLAILWRLQPCGLGNFKTITKIHLSILCFLLVPCYTLLMYKQSHEIAEESDKCVCLIVYLCWHSQTICKVSSSNAMVMHLSWNVPGQSRGGYWCWSRWSGASFVLRRHWKRRNWFELCGGSQDRLSQDSQSEDNSKHFSSFILFILYFRWQCASSTLQNIMFRFGEKNNLTFVLPNVGGNLGGNIS